MNINKVSQSINAQTPDFIGSEYPLFNKFIEYYYRSQEKTGLGQNILNNFLQYLDIDKLDINILDGKTTIVEPLSATDDTIVVESVESFLSTNGTILIGDEVVFYEKTTSAPNIALSPGISYEQVKLKWTILANPIDSFDGSRVRFPLTSQDSPIAPPTAQHLIVNVYGEVLVPYIDYTVDGTDIVFTNAPRTRIPADDNAFTFINYLSGFVENTIVGIDNLSNAFGEGKRQFTITRNGQRYEPIVDEYVIAIYDNRLMLPKVDYFIDGDQFIFATAPINGRFLSLYSVEAPIPSFGSGAVGYARVNDNGEITSVNTSEFGTGYRFEYPPKVSVNSNNGSGASVQTLVNGIKSLTLLEGGRGYSETNPPVVQVESPTKEGSFQATFEAVVNNGSVTQLNIVQSGSGYTFTPRITFVQPGGASLGTPEVTNGQITGTIEIVSGGFGYSTAPAVYIDEPTGLNGIQAVLTSTINSDGNVIGINIVNPGQGYETTPRIAIIEPVGAQVLETVVDNDGRVIGVQLLSGGDGYEDVPSVYIVDDRENGGSGAKAVASIFNGKITDINVTEFGSGYSADNPPKVVIQSPPQAKASAEIGLQEITGFRVNQSGSGYEKAKFEGCARAASGIVNYTEDGNVIFSNNTTAALAEVDTEVKCLDSVFVKRLLDKYKEQFLPDVPELDYKKIDVRTSIKTIKDFYSSKGTSFSISYLFKLLYGEQVSISYPKDQIIKPSAATWSIDTILRATLVSGDPTNIKDALLVQEEDIADPNIRAASALVENYISIKTSTVEIFELVLSEETINGTFTVPYKTKLAEPLNQTDSIITVDSTIGWPERNGEFIIGDSEVVQYKEKSLNQFIECTRSVNGVVEDWDSATEVASNFRVYLNKGTPQEVVMNVVGIVDAQQTSLTDTGSYYLPGDKLTVSKLGGSSDRQELKTWLYNVKKLVEVTEVQFGGINDRFATVTCSNPHGLLVGDQVTVYGANPIIYNGTFLVTSRDSATVFQYQLPQPATVVPQGNILVSVDLNKGKSDTPAVNNAISPYTTNVQNSFFNEDYVYVASTGIPNYKIGPFPGSALLPGNQRKLNRFPLTPVTISNKNLISPGPIGTWINGVSAWSYKSNITKTFGAITSIDTDSIGEGYDAASPPTITISGGNGTGATAEVVVDGSINEITVESGGSGYTSSPLVSIVGGGGSGASATAIITKGSVSRVLIVDGGTGYTSQPSITIVGGGGSGATASASVRGPIKSISVTNGGASYTSKPSIVLSSGSGAVAQPIVNDGRIISIAIISAGQGYTTAPEVTIQGDGFGAVARANIDVDGENAGRVTSIEIVNRGIGYTQGNTVINLTSVGQGARFSANVFQWTYNLEKTSVFDSAKGAVFEGYNNQYGGEYGHLANPQTLRYILGDNLFENTAGNILEQEDQLEHSPIIGWAFDGNPIYGPYGYIDPTNQSSEISRLNTSYRLKTNLVYNDITNPYPSRVEGPLLTDEPAGNFVEDYEYVFGLGDLDQYNGRFCKTPEYPDGRYCYFVSIDATENGNPVFPYVLGPSFNSVVDKWNLSTSAVQQNIPTGVVRYRDPYENVDIDVERVPNASTNTLTTENGDILLFEVEDENKDGIISQDEIDDPEEILEESPLQLYDYFPSVRFDSKVDIEVETTTKFEDASVTGFTIENPGENYQVNDRLVFDNTGTDGTGVSARISRISGEDVSSYTFETVRGENYGILQTAVPHNLAVGDTVFVDYEPIMDNTNKTFVVRQIRGIEEVVIEQTGSGYSEEIPPEIIIDGDGQSGELTANVSSVGSIDSVNIINSGYGYQQNPRVILSHPQTFKKADYYVSLIENREYLKVNDVVVNDSKEIFVCGKTLDVLGNTVAFISKLSATGVKQWEKTLDSSDGAEYAEFQKLYVDGDSIWVVGNNRPNSVILDAYNPDIILAKYDESSDGLDATLDFQRAFAGISGSTRSDNITTIKKLSENRFVLGGYTNTNSQNPYDAFIATVDLDGNFSVKRKIASTKSEKLVDIIVSGSDVYFIMETSTSVNGDDVNVSIGKASIGSNVITINWIKETSNSVYSFLNSSLVIDEYNELYVTSTLRLKSDDVTKDSFWVGKLDTDGNYIWNYRYIAPGRDIEVVQKTVIDIFGDLNVAYSRTDITTGYKTVDTVKLSYTGAIQKHTTTEFNLNNIEGITAHSLDVDNSGDIHVFGQTSWNRNEFIFEFDETDDATDKTGHYTPTLIGNDATEALALVGDGVAKLFGKDVATPANWENAAIKFAAADVGTKLGDDWTLEFMLYKDATNSQTHSQTQQTLVAIGDATDATGGLWLYYDISSGQLELVVTNNTTALNNAGTGLTSTQTTMFADDTWQFIGLKKEGDVFTGYVNGIQIFTGSVTNTSLESKDLYIGNIPGKNGTPAAFVSVYQGQYYVDNLRLRNRAVTPTVPSDVLTIPPTASFALAYDWTDDAWFTTNMNQYDYIDYVGFGIKSDRNSDADRLGDKGEQTNTGVGFARTAVSPVTGSTLTLSTVGFALSEEGFQSLDFDNAITTMAQNTETLSYSNDVWGSRTATVPSPGSQKLRVSAIVKDRYFFKVTDTVKIDNIQELTINQSFRFTTGSKLVLNNDAGSFVNSGYIIKSDTTTNKIYLAINNNDWSNDTNLGNLITEQFNEQDTYGIVGPIPNDVNDIVGYTFAQVNNTTPGTFDIDLANYDAPEGGSNNLDEFAKFKPYNDDEYSVRIDEVSGASPYIVGSVITIDSNSITYNAAYSTTQITGLTGVLKITLITTLSKILQVTAVANSDEVYVVTDTKHYLSAGENIFVDGNPSQQVGNVVYDEYDGSFAVDTVVSPVEFTYKLPQAAVSNPATNASDVSIFVKSPVLKMYYGHQYLFDMSHSSLLGSNLSFSKDNLYKLEYSFNSIERIGTPGVTGEGQPTPTIKLKVDRDIVTNISYYFDPSRPDDNSPVIRNSYLDVTFSPYIGNFEITSVSGATITRGADTFKFLLVNEPEGNADVSRTSYSTSSTKAVGSIANIRIINPGGFYTRLPVVSNIVSTRNIERVQINDPGTEYAPGLYTGVPISGNGEGGFVEITVADGTDDEGELIPGQIQKVVVTSPGKGYTTATIDVESINGILGPGLTGSGADLEVVIPPFGTGASIFTKGTSVGKIKKLKNNNFGYDYPHDYTLRPEITFPINAQLTATSILDSITVTDPGSGYSQPPAVVITGGGGSGAIAEATIRNGRLEQIIVKDAGAGYSSTPTVALRSSFNYVVNLDLGLLQFAFPHGIPNGSAVSLNVVDTGDGAEFPLASGAIGRLNASTTYYAITGTANSLEDDQMKLAITEANADIGDAITFVNAGIGRQQVLTESFGGAAKANVITSTFLEGELVYQGDSLDNATATGYISTNNGWQVGPRIIKVVDYDGTFIEGQQVTGVISKSSGTISDLKIAKGVLEIGSITKTTGQFIDDVGKPSEIIQKIQDSYYYQDFSYAIRSAVSIGEWKDILINNVHPASFKVFGELNVSEYGSIPNKETDFELVKSVELAQEAIVPNIQNFTLVEPIYSEFNNTEVLFRQKRLTSSENILTSVVQRLDNISDLFDGERIAFPLTVDGNNVVASANQLMIILNGVVQNPDTAFEIQGDSIVFSEPPQPPASVKYVDVTIEQIDTFDLFFRESQSSGILPNIGNDVVGITSSARLKVTSVRGATLTQLDGNGNPVLDNQGNEVTYEGNFISGYITEGTFVVGETCTISATGFSGTLESITAVTNIGLFNFGESITNFDGDVATVEQVNLETGKERPLAKLRYTIGPSTTSIDFIDADSETDAPVPAEVFNIGSNYQLGSEIFTVNTVTNNSDSTTVGVTRAVLGTASISHLEDTPLYGTEIEITNALTLSKTAGTYQSTPGLFDIQLNDVIIAAQSGVVARITSTSAYQDPTTEEFISQVNISDGSSFFGLLFNRIASATYPNVVLDDISQSQINIVDFTDNLTAFDIRFPSNELINNYIIPYDNESGAFQEDEFIRNFKIEYGNNSGEFIASESARVRKLTFKNQQGTGFFQLGQVLKTRDTKAEIIGYNQARSTIYLGKIGRVLNSGQDYHTATFNNSAQLDTAQKKFGSSSLLLDDATTDYLSIPTSTEFGFGTGAFTVECWIRPDDVSAGDRHIFDMRDSGADANAGRLYIATNQVRFNIGGSDVVTSGATTLSADTWYHIAITRSGTDLKLFVDGSEAGSTTNSTDLGSTKRLFIGADFAGSNPFSGHIDEFRVSTVARYTAAFSPLNGIHQGDANAVLLVHFDGEDAQTYTEDWSGGESFTNGEGFHNDAILATSRLAGAPVGFTGNSHRVYNAAESIRLNKDFIAQETVYLLLQQYPSLVIPGGNVNCEDDIRDVLDQIIEDLKNGSNSHMWDAAAIYVDRTQNPVTLNHIETEVTETIWAFNKVDEMLQYIINNVAWTVQGDHGLTQTLNTDPTNIYEGGSPSLSNCADVYTTINNLIDILTDTLSEADTPSATPDGDHLDTVTRVEPAFEFVGGDIDAFYEVPFPVSYHNGTDDLIYANQIDEDTRNRFYDAANLIRSNLGPIVDKASADLLTRYPDLAIDMPRNESGDGSGTLRCKTDLTLILNEIVKDIENGGNANTVQAAKFYLGENDELIHIRLQVFQSVYAHKRLGFYMKQAINGDLDYTNTDKIIVGDWGITNDPGGCANVQSAIDTLIDTFNDIIAPTDSDYEIGADRLYFNREYLTEEVLGLVDEEFTYQLGSSNFTAINYDDELNLESLIIAIISDLQTGGTNSTVRDAENYLSAALRISDGLDDTVLAALYAVEQLGVLGQKAIENLLYDNGDSIPVGGYEAVHAETNAYRDSETPSNIANVTAQFNTLIQIIIDIFAPGDDAARGAAKNVLFNKNYYTDEITQTVNNQFGSGSWQYDDFVETIVDNFVHDATTTDITDKQNAYRVTLVNVTDDFTAGETVTSSGGGTAEVLEWDSVTSSLYIGDVTGTAYASGQTLTGGDSGATGLISGLGGSVDFDGNYDYLRYAASSELNFASNPFTAEAWFYWDTNNFQFGIFGSVAQDFRLYVSTSSISFWDGSRFTSFSTSAATKYAWHHIAVVRDGTGLNQMRIYLDGDLIGTGTSSRNYTTSMELIIGAGNTFNAYSANGQISNVRILNGTALYSGSEFVVPQAPLTEIADTAILTCQGSFDDNSSNSIGVTAVGNTSVSTNSPFASGGGITSAFDWYTNPTNVKTLNYARTLTSNIAGQISGVNLWTYPEQLNQSVWVSYFLYSEIADQIFAPDNTLTADKIRPSNSFYYHYLYRQYSLTPYETFDSTSNTTRFDKDNVTFDNGANDSTQQFTASMFFKKGEYDQIKFVVQLDGSVSPAINQNSRQAFFDVNLSTGAVGSIFAPSTITVDDYGVIPYGNGWYRVYLTASFGLGFTYLYQIAFIKNENGSEVYASNNLNNGIYGWGGKLNKGALDPYTAQSGQIFYADEEYNIKVFTLGLLREYMNGALSNSLISPSPNASIQSYYDSTVAANYSADSFARLVRYYTNIIEEQIAEDSYYTGLTSVNGISLPTKTYGTRTIPVGIGGGLRQADYVYGTQSDSNAEVESVIPNEGQIVKVYQRFRIDGDITDGPFTMNESVEKQGDNAVTGVVYGFHEDENFKYLDVEVTGNAWAILDTIVGDDNGTTAQISAIENRIQIVDLVGEFNEDIPFRGFTSTNTATPTDFYRNEASVTSNVGGKLTVDTETLSGTFEKTCVVYPESSKQYIDVVKYAGLDLNVGDRIASTGHIRLGISVITDGQGNVLNGFTRGNFIYRSTNNALKDENFYGIITDVDLDNNFVYIQQIQGTFAIGDTVGDYGVGGIDALGLANITTKVTVAGAGSALVQDIRTIGINKRLYLSDLAGTISGRDSIIGPDGYKSAAIASIDLKARVKRSFRGFDGVQTTFTLTQGNGIDYFPDPEGHMLIFINGILQPPGGTNAFTAFSNQIQFTEAPELGASFTGFYVGKLRQLDDISFEFDSLRQSFNLKRNEIFYSLTLTEGVQSSTIRPENNIIVSLNGVVQEPGVGFEIVGSRIIFSEIPRVGSTFVAFSYVGSEADVDAAEVVPPIEPGDLISIQGEITDREVAVIESSNSLITFDYLGSVFGKDAVGQANLTNGFIERVQVTAGGSGYTTRPTVRVDSISGFDANIKAIVGVAGVEISSAGSGYQNPAVEVENVVPDDWTAPDLSLYGEEVIDPEILP
jgi:hypothetical protein